MKRFMRRIATVGVSVAIAGGALFATGSSAIAATPPASGHIPTHVAVAEGAGAGHDDRFVGEPGNPKSRIDPWIQDQLEMSDPWIMDQLVLFSLADTPVGAMS